MAKLDAGQCVPVLRNARAGCDVDRQRVRPERNDSRHQRNRGCCSERHGRRRVHRGIRIVGNERAAGSVGRLRPFEAERRAPRMATVGYGIGLVPQLLRQQRRAFVIARRLVAADESESLW
jgi:hypothetical protein